ncbi:gag/pol protein [Cucumis melo var. makuwa]|uniref:Gag/pol protein n=1 Tax=Cucumis melo var. makuwa TaxID=1194695 RepID=A0A5A7UYX7_CUCMM|nr:gag/pol protein [Cucumis melo var. makuwa]
MTTATLNMLAADKLNGNNYASWKNTINIVLIIDDLKFVLVEECPQVPAANATQTVREPYERWAKGNEKGRAYILASLSEVLAKKHESMLTAREIMDSLQEMFGQASYQINHDALKYIYNARMNEGASVREHVLNMMVHFNVAEMNGAVIDEASQGQKGEANVATSTRKFHRGSTSGTKSMPSSSGNKKWKKKKGGQGNKANLAAAKTTKKSKATKGICFHYNQEGHWKRNCPKYLAEKKKAKQGHINLNRIERLVKNGILSELEENSLPICESCLEGKMTKRPFTGKGHRAKEPLELVHSDLCGPMNVKARGEFEYFITFTDDYSRYGYVYLMQHKSEALEKFKEYKAEVENALSKTIKTFRSDRGGEYMDLKFQNYLMECEILSQLSAPGTPQQNGVSERRNRTLLDMVRSMISYAHLPNSFWGYAVQTAVYILNYVPSKSVYETPLKLWNGRKGSLRHFRIWGCPAHVLENNPKKLEPRSKLCLFVGYPKGTRGGYFYDLKDNKVFVLTNATFLEKDHIREHKPRSKIVLNKLSKEITEPSTRVVEESSALTRVVHVGSSTRTYQPQTLREPRRSGRVTNLPIRYMSLTETLTVISDGDIEDPLTFKKAMEDVDKDEWIKAMNLELESMYFNSVWDLVDQPDGVKPIGCKWIYKRKRGADGKTAFLNDNLEETIYMQQPEGFIIPGLLTDIKQWLATQFQMKDLGEADFVLGIQIFRDRKNKTLALSQASYIDKIVVKYSMQNSKRGLLPFRHEVTLSKEQCPKTPQDVEEMRHIPYASVVGSLMYVMLCIRPDICYAVGIVSRYQSNLGLAHWTAVKTILKYLRRTRDYMLVYGSKDLILTEYTDSDFQTDRDSRKSILGSVFTLNGGAVVWRSIKQGCIADSTMEAEYVAACEVAKEAVWLRKFLIDLEVVPNMSKPITLYCDNSGAVANSREPRSHKRGKHIKRKYHLIREIVQRGDVIVTQIASTHNVADPFTKPLTAKVFEGHLESLGLRDMPHFI